uniref:FKBP-type peptidyl-prolyl cis-trans isomerase n=1 Tax=Thaumasiovibrio subtropicus TaxID=1891207 RepID=UPI000B34EBE9|nr:FKBP-type peptidyl-prolyl cis-trans isomerase [Thaumasiovibrio subtropicus]
MKAFVIAAIILVVFIIIQRSLSGRGAEENIKIGQEYLAQNAEQEGVVTTDSGLQYLVLEEGTGTVHPSAKDKVRVHYHGKLIDGTVFDSSVDRGEPIDFSLGQVIKGWTEGLQYMVEGEKVRLFIPANLAYGNRGVGAIPAGSMLIFDVELIKINP